MGMNREDIQETIITEIVTIDNIPAGVMVKDCAWCGGIFAPERLSHKYCRSACWKSASNAVPFQFDLFYVPNRGRRSPRVHAS